MDCCQDAPATGKGTSLHGVPGVLAMHGAKNVNVTNCTFRHLGLTGVLADDGSQGIRVTHSHFADLSGSAVALGNVSKAIMTPEEQDGQFTVENNRIRDTGAEYQVRSNAAIAPLSPASLALRLLFS